MRPLPSGSVTFLFTDIEGSTRLDQRLGRDYVALIRRHDELVGDAIDRCSGVVVKSLGDGIFAAFGDAGAAVAAAAEIQSLVLSEQWPAVTRLRVRIGLHSGDAEPQGGDYIAVAVHQAARVAAAAHGGQILMTRAVWDAIEDRSSGAVRTLGDFRLRDFDDPVELLQLTGPDLDTDFPALRAMPAAAHNVPLITTAFIGRSSELDELAALLDGHRLVTIAAPGGAGKTRLAFEYARGAAQLYSDGTWVVLLAGLAEPSGLAARVATTVGVVEQPHRPLLTSLAEALSARQMLLVLDNCEHLVEQVAELAAHLLAICPGITILATSQEPLRVRGEYVWRLPALGSDEHGDAGLLFLDRARSVHPSFAPAAADLATIRRICVMLDGMPLAIELAAARVRHLRPPDLERRLRRVLPILTGGPRDAPARQQTLRATIEWSHGLLNEDQQVMFRRLAVFRTPFTLAAAERICADESLAPDDILPLVSDLLDRSVIAEAAVDDAAAYRMLATLREFADERLHAAGENDAVRVRHAQYFRETTLVGSLPPCGAAPVDSPALCRIEDEINAALEWGIDQTAGEIVPTIGELACIWAAHCFRQGRFSEGPSWCRRVLALDLHPRLRADVLYHLSLLLLLGGDPGAAEPVARELERLTADTELFGRSAGAAHVLADAAFSRRDFEEAERQYRRAMELYRADGSDPAATGVVLRDLATLPIGTVGERRARFDEALAVLRAAGNTFEEVRTLVIAGCQSDFCSVDERESLLGQAFRLATEERLVTYTAGAVAGMSRVAADRGDLILAAHLYGAADRIADSVGSSVAVVFGTPTHPEVETLRAELCAALGEAAFSQAAAAGADRQVDELLDVGKTKMT